jgi:exportin-5
LLFGKSALRVRDSHSVSCVLATLKEVVPLFREPGPVHDFICDELLKSAIMSLHEPYFVEQQRDLAALIVHIILLDGDLAGRVICSLPVLSSQPDKVATAIERIQSCHSERVGRALVLELLEQIRGLSIHEMGRIGGPKKSKTHQKLLDQYAMSLDMPPKIDRGGSPSLEGVGELLG